MVGTSPKNHSGHESCIRISLERHRYKMKCLFTLYLGMMKPENPSSSTSAFHKLTQLLALFKYSSYMLLCPSSEQREVCELIQKKQCEVPSSMTAFKTYCALQERWQSHCENILLFVKPSEQIGVDCPKSILPAQGHTRVHYRNQRPCDRGRAFLGMGVPIPSKQLLSNCNWISYHTTIDLFTTLASFIMA